MISFPSPPNETSLQKRMEALRTSFADREDLVCELEKFVRTAPDEQLIRINPFVYATDHDRSADHVVELFLHARKAGLFTMEWQYICHVCGMVVESFQALNAAGEHFFCKTCIAQRDADLSDFVEIGFTVSQAVRLTPFHDPNSLSASDFLSKYAFSASALTRNGTKLREFYARGQLFVDHLEPGETKTFRVNLEPAFVGFTHGPEMLVDPDSTERIELLDFTHYDKRPAEAMKVVAPGPLTYKLTNAGSERIVTTAIHIGAEELQSIVDLGPGIRLGNFLSGSRLLTNQTFRDLFPSETVMGMGGLAVNRVALLFTDIKGSTQLYERVGDFKAFSLVREHFGLLRDVIAANHGALVKTIGDAVMASFDDPLDLVRAGLGIDAEIRRFNADAGEDLIALKLGAHAGPCIAVTLNERLDYFGQTVNLAARVQGLAAANQFCLTDQLYRVEGVPELTAEMPRETKTVQVKGLEHKVKVQVLSDLASSR